MRSNVTYLRKTSRIGTGGTMPPVRPAWRRSVPTKRQEFVLVARKATRVFEAGVYKAKQASVFSLAFPYEALEARKSQMDAASAGGESRREHWRSEGGFFWGEHV